MDFESFVIKFFVYGFGTPVAGLLGYWAYDKHIATLSGEERTDLINKAVLGLISVGTKVGLVKKTDSLQKIIDKYSVNKYRQKREELKKNGVNCEHLDFLSRVVRIEKNLNQIHHHPSYKERVADIRRRELASGRRQSGLTPSLYAQLYDMSSDPSNIECTHVVTKKVAK